VGDPDFAQQIGAESQKREAPEKAVAGRTPGI